MEWDSRVHSEALLHHEEHNVLVAHLGGVTLGAFLNHVIVGFEQQMDAVHTEQAREPQAERADERSGHLEGERNGQDTRANVGFDHVHQRFVARGSLLLWEHVQLRK